MVFNRQNLLLTLKQCLAGNGIEMNDSFTFYRGRVFTYNGEISVSKKIDFTDAEDLNFSIKGTDFFKIIEKFKYDEIKVDFTEKTVKMVCGKSHVEIPFLNIDASEKYQNFIDIDGWTDVDENLTIGMMMCSIAGNKSPYDGVYVSGNNVYSTDGYQINQYYLKREMPTFYINSKSVSELIKNSHNFTKIKVDKWLYLQDEADVIFATRVIDSSFYPIDVINNYFNGIAEQNSNYTLPNELIDVIKRASVFASEQNSRDIIDLTFKGNIIIVSSEKISGKFSEEIELDYSFGFDEEKTIRVDKDMIGYALKNDLQFTITDDDKIFLTTENSRHIMATFSK